MSVKKKQKKIPNKISATVILFVCAKVVGEWAPDLTLELGFSLSYTLTAAAHSYELLAVLRSI